MARATSGGKKPAARGTKSTSRKRAAPPPVITLRPEHQRELFALALIAIAALTIVFFATGSAGAIGSSWVEFTRRMLGWGALVVPMSLGLLGGAILFQERREDVKLTGVTILGTLLVLASLLVLLDLALGVREDGIDYFGEGGGVIGQALLDALSRAIGRTATLVLTCLIGLAGVMLTFDITLRELIDGFSGGFARFWQTVWGGTSSSLARKPAAVATPRGELAYQPPPGTQRRGAAPQPDDADLVATPIAERQTKRSLFDRPDIQLKPDAKAEKLKKSKADAAPEKVLTDLLATPSIDVRPPAVPVAVVQEPLDGFETQAVHHAWPLPALDLLETYPEGSVSADEIQHKARVIEETLASFKVEVQVRDVNVGPAVTQYELQPAVGIKVSKITTLEKDLQLALAANSLRIEAPIPGKSTVGIEIPNSSVSTVGLREIMESDAFEHGKGKLKIGLGRDVSGMPVVTGLERMPHLLMAGATGAGKSAGINSIICALLLKHTPDELKFIMVDPKMVEMSVYNNVPHMLSPVVTEMERVVPTLKWATKEMERRYKVFARYGFRNIDSYKLAARRRADLEPMPYIVIIIDELADLMMMAPDEVETLICRLAQMARATGIHLVIATQRPSVDVVTGLIKANFPSRLAFAVTSQIDSRVILDSNGAEQLLGRGDSLFMAADASRPVRVQGTWVSEIEVERIVQFWKQAKPPESSDAAAGDRPRQGDAGKGAAAADQPRHASHPPLTGPGEFLSVDEQEELLPDAIKLVQQHKRASASLLQRRLRIGYSKAAQLIELLEQQGVVGPAEDGRSREVLDREDAGMP